MRTSQNTQFAVRTSPPNRWRQVILFLFLMASVGVIVTVYHYKQQVRTIFTTYHERFSALLAARRHPAVANLTKKKQIAMDESFDEPIHFEFYSMLPSTRVNLAEMEDDLQTPPAKPIKPAAIHKTTTPKTTTQKITTPTLAIKADELERELSHQLAKKLYIIQLGVFRNANAAKRYQKNLAASGIKTSIITIKNGNKTLYRLQQGPFSTQKIAKLNADKLRGKGVAHLLHVTKDSSNNV